MSRLRSLHLSFLSGSSSVLSPSLFSSILLQVSSDSISGLGGGLLYVVVFPYSVGWTVGASVWKPFCCILLNLGVDLGVARCLGLHLEVGVFRIVLTVDFRALAMEVSVFL